MVEIVKLHYPDHTDLKGLFGVVDVKALMPVKTPVTPAERRSRFFCAQHHWVVSKVWSNTEQLSRGQKVACRKNLLRLSVGIEDEADLIADLEHILVGAK